MFCVKIIYVKIYIYHRKIIIRNQRCNTNGNHALNDSYILSAHKIVWLRVFYGYIPVKNDMYAYSLVLHGKLFHWSKEYTHLFNIHFVPFKTGHPP